MRKRRSQISDELLAGLLASEDTQQSFGTVDLLTELPIPLAKEAINAGMQGPRNFDPDFGSDNWFGWRKFNFRLCRSVTLLSSLCCRRA